MTSFNLAPRGFGRASFRLSEIVQVGRIPVYIYDDYPWAAYMKPGSNISVTAIGFVAKLGHIADVVKRIAAMTPDEIAEKMELVKRARYFYTYEGVMDQIDLFFRDPLGPQGGFLSCSKIPSSLYSVLDINI